VDKATPRESRKDIINLPWGFDPKKEPGEPAALDEIMPFVTGM
jgi:hypothetical protein